MTLRGITRLCYVAIVIAIAVTVGATLGAKQAVEAAGAAAARQLAIRTAGDDLKSHSANLSNAVRRYVVTSDDQHAQYYELTSIPERWHTLRRAAIVLGLAVDETAQLDAAIRSAETLVSIESQALRVARNGDPERARELLFDEGHEIQQADINNQLESFASMSNGRAEEAARAARAQADMMVGLAALAAGLLAVGVAVVLFGIFERRIVSPLTTLDDVVQDLAQERLDMDVPFTDSEDEIGRLARSLNVLKQTQKDNQLLRNDLAVLATTDPLTGALNRRAFLDQTLRHVAHLHRYGGHLAIIMTDIDFFKKINDNYGHPAGDEALKRLVADFKGHLRKSDILGRLGGEEFAVVLPEQDTEHAARVAEKLRQIAAAIRLDVAGRELHFTCSFGVAEVVGDETGVEPAMARADAALYAAKTGGRNQVQRAPIPETTAAA